MCECAYIHKCIHQALAYSQAQIDIFILDLLENRKSWAHMGGLNIRFSQPEGKQRAGWEAVASCPHSPRSRFIWSRPHWPRTFSSRSLYLTGCVTCPLFVYRLAPKCHCEPSEWGTASAPATWKTLQRIPLFILQAPRGALQETHWSQQYRWWLRRLFTWKFTFRGKKKTVLQMDRGKLYR